MKNILLDTNFFLVPFQLGINVFDELTRVVEEPFEIMTLSCLKGELNSIANKGKGDDKISAKLGIELAKNIRVEETSKKGDDAILHYTKTHKDVIVATNDSKLRKRLKEEKIKTIFVRGINKLDME